MKGSIEQKLPLSLLLINLFIAFLGIGLVVPILPTFMRDLNLSGGTMGYLVAIFAFAQLLISPFSGIWIDKIGRKKMIVLGLFLFSFSELIFALGNQVGMLYFSRILGGVAAAFIMPAVTAFVSDITTLDERPKALGYVSAAISTGFIVGPGIGGFLAEFSIRTPFFFASGIALVAAIFSLLVLKEPLTKEKLQKNRDSQEKSTIFTELKKSLRPVYFIPLIIVLASALGLAAYETVFGLFVDQKFGFNAKDIATIITISAILGVIAQVVFFSRLVEKLGEKKLIKLVLLIAVIAMIFSVFVRGYWSILLVTFVVFLTFDLLRPALTSLLSRVAGEEQGFVAGMNSTYTSLGNILGPASAGILFDVNIQYPYLFASLLLIITYGVTLSWNIKKSEPGV